MSFFVHAVLGGPGHKSEEEAKEENLLSFFPCRVHSKYILEEFNLRSCADLHISK